MWLHFVNLSLRTWHALVQAFGTTTLGFFLFALVVPILTAVLTALWFYFRHHREWKAITASAVRTGFTTLAAVVLVVCVSYVVCFIPTVYEDHQLLAKRLVELAKENKALRKDLEVHRHGMVTSDAVFANTIYLLQAFRMYRHAIGPDAKCTIYVTAPPDAAAVASLTTQFQISVSNCATFGPMDNASPSGQHETTEGSKPGFVTINAPEGDRGADELMSQLTHVFRVDRGYKSIPKGRLAEAPQSNAIWMQFGQGATFESELREAKK